MNTVSVRRKILLALLVTVLVTPWVSAAGPQAESPRSVRAVEPVALDFFSRIWSFLRRVGSKEGCNIDPSGRCSSENPSPQTKEGCHIDPSGGCLP